MKKLFLLSVFFPVFMFSQTNYYVALETNGGNDSLNTGTINSPFKTINKALSFMNSGDTCFIRSGTYHQEVIVNGKNNIVITPYNNEFVCFEGTQQITSNWIPYNGNIFQTTLNRHIWQLFVDNNQMVMARWPNANFTDTSIYSLDTWASGIVDSVLGYPDGSYNGFELVDTSKFNLGLTGLDVTGAIGIMNVGSFKTFNRQITSHNANDNFFNYNTVPNNTYRDKHHNFYLEGKLELLDQANEWFYDTISKKLYLYPEDGQNPNGRIIKGKIQDYAINIINSSHVTIDNIYFFATTFLAKSSSDIIIANCNFSYPNCSKRMLKDFLSSPNVSSLGASGNVNKVNNSVIKKCLFEYTDGEALRVYGDNNLIENCYMRFIDYSVSELPFLMVGVYIDGDSNRFLHNTIHHSSASAFIAPGTSPEFAYNEVYATGSLQSDGSVYQGTTATVENSNVHHNYIHDTPKYALRFDAPGGSPGQAGQYGKMHHNIVVRTNGIMVKGNHHYICHNTTFSSKKNGLIILDDDNSNDSSYIYNNFSEKMSAHRSNQTPIPGIHSNNWNGYDNPDTNFFTQLDTINYLPLPNSSLVDSGVTIPAIPHQIFNTAADIGALEFGITAWLAGVDWSPIYFPWILGCTDSNACNYDSLANTDDGSCIYPSTSTTSVTTCDSSYTWNDSTYIQSGTYSYSGGASNNYSASLDGINDYVDVGNNSVLDIDNSVTIEAWINPSNLSTRHAIYSTRKNNNPGSFQLEIGTYTGPDGPQGGVGINYVAVTGVNTWVAITGNNVINNNGGWVHIAYTRDGVGNNHEIYINGIPQIINTNPYTFINNNSLKEIGRGTTALQNYDGQIDQVRIWDIALTQLEIQNYMNCSPNGTESGLVGYWNFEEGQGATVYDQTSNGNDGTINGAIYNTNVPSQSCVLTNTNGCDSTAVLNLTINNAVTTSNTVSICSGDSFSVGTSTYNTAGTYIDTLTTVDGCDSILTTTLTVDPIGCTDVSAINYDSNAICDDGSCIATVNGCTDPAACNYDPGANTDDGSCNTVYGCMDPTQFNYNVNATCDDASCQPFTYGCTDASASNYNSTVNTDDGSCIWLGCTDATAANYDATATVDDGSCIYSGCTDPTACNYDSTANTDNGSCNYSTTSTSIVTACDSYDWNGTTYNSTGVYTFASTNSNGCDSTATLNLTINPSTTSSVSVTECDSYTWNGITYNASGVYTFASTNSNGCDSTATLNLTINPSTTSTSNVTECDSYDWNGTTYSSSGMYNYSTTNFNGCDSTVTLNLTINYSNTGTTSVTACNTYLWNAQTITTSGSYNQTFTNVDGCDSTHTLNVTIIFTTIIYDTVSICKGESYVVSNSTYNNTGDYTDTILNSNGCLSIIYTNLTVGSYLNSSITQVGSVLESTVNGGFMPYSYLWNTLATTEDINITSNGLYWLVVTDSLSCPVDTAYYNGELHTSISEIGISDLKVYPNPSRDIFNIVFSSNTIQNLDVRVINVVGEVIVSEELDQFLGEYSKQINLEKNAKGIYFLEIETNDGIINKKLILQ
jgi:hypothetical protein